MELQVLSTLSHSKQPRPLHRQNSLNIGHPAPRRTLNDSRSPVLLSRAMQLSVVAAVVSLHPLLYDHLLTIVQVLVIDARNVQPMCKLLPRLLSNVSTATKTIMLAIVKILGPVSVPSQRHVVSAIQKRTSATSVINVRQRLVVTAI